MELYVFCPLNACMAGKEYILSFHFLRLKRRVTTDKMNINKDVEERVCKGM
jgi:hypothetical protein